MQPCHNLTSPLQADYRHTRLARLPPKFIPISPKSFPRPMPARNLRKIPEKPGKFAAESRKKVPRSAQRVHSPRLWHLEGNFLDVFPAGVGCLVVGHDVLSSSSWHGKRGRKVRDFGLGPCAMCRLSPASPRYLSSERHSAAARGNFSRARNYHPIFSITSVKSPFHPGRRRKAEATLLQWPFPDKGRLCSVQTGKGRAKRAESWRDELSAGEERAKSYPRLSPAVSEPPPPLSPRSHARKLSTCPPAPSIFPA